MISQEIIILIITTITGGIGWLVKRWWDRKEEERKLEIEERNRRRESIEDRLSRLEKDSKMFQSMILSCDNPECKVKKVLADYFKKDL